MHALAANRDLASRIAMQFEPERFSKLIAPRFTRSDGQISLNAATYFAERMNAKAHLFRENATGVPLVVQGTCCEPFIGSGDIVWLDHGADVHDGDFVVFRPGPKEAAEYALRIGTPAPYLVAKFLTYLAGEWWYVMNDCMSPLEVETVVGPVVAITRKAPVAESGQLALNAATVVASTSIAGPTNVYTASASFPATLVGSISIGPLNVDATIVITVTGSVDHIFPSAQCSTCMTVSTSTLTTFSGTSDTWIARNPSTAVAEASMSFAREYVFTLLSGTSQTYYLYAYAGTGAAVAGASSNLYGISLKAEAIKR